MVVVFRHIDEGGQTLAEPHSHLPVHVDGEGLKPLLQAAHSVIFEGAGILPQIHATNLSQAETAHWNKP